MGSRWKEAHSRWSRRCCASSVIFDGYIWILGGKGDGNKRFSDVWKSKDGKNWECVIEEAEWEARSAHTSVVHDGHIWIIGGRDNEKDFNNVWKSKDGKTWEEVSKNLDGARPFHASVVHDTAACWPYLDPWRAADRQGICQRSLEEQGR